MSYKYCTNFNEVRCSNSKHFPCDKCTDITEATEFLLKELKPKSGKLTTGCMNNDHAAYLLTKFVNEKCKK